MSNHINPYEAERPFGEPPVSVGDQISGAALAHMCGQPVSAEHAAMLANQMDSLLQNGKECNVTGAACIAAAACGINEAVSRAQEATLATGREETPHMQAVKEFMGRGEMITSENREAFNARKQQILAERQARSEVPPTHSVSESPASPSPSERSQLPAHFLKMREAQQQKQVASVPDSGENRTSPLPEAPAQPQALQQEVSISTVQTREPQPPPSITEAPGLPTYSTPAIREQPPIQMVADVPTTRANESLPVQRVSVPAIEAVQISGMFRPEPEAKIESGIDSISPLVPARVSESRPTPVREFVQDVPPPRDQEVSKDISVGPVLSLEQQSAPPIANKGIPSIEQLIPVPQVVQPQRVEVFAAGPPVLREQSKPPQQRKKESQEEKKKPDSRVLQPKRPKNAPESKAATPRKAPELSFQPDDQHTTESSFALPTMDMSEPETRIEPGEATAEQNDNQSTKIEASWSEPVVSESAGSVEVPSLLDGEVSIPNKSVDTVSETSDQELQPNVQTQLESEPVFVGETGETTTVFQYQEPFQQVIEKDDAFQGDIPEQEASLLEIPVLETTDGEHHLAAEDISEQVEPLTVSFGETASVLPEQEVFYDTADSLETDGKSVSIEQSEQESGEIPVQFTDEESVSEIYTTQETDPFTESDIFPEQAISLTSGEAREPMNIPFVEERIVIDQPEVSGTIITFTENVKPAMEGSIAIILEETPTQPELSPIGNEHVGIISNESIDTPRENPGEIEVRQEEEPADEVLESIKLLLEEVLLLLTEEIEYPVPLEREVSDDSNEASDSILNRAEPAPEELDLDDDDGVVHISLHQICQLVVILFQSYLLLIEQQVKINNPVSHLIVPITKGCSCKACACKKKKIKEVMSRGKDSNLRSHKTPDLQSGAIGHSATSGIESHTSSSMLLGV